MIEAYALSAVALAAAGVVLTLLAVISLKIRHEEAAYTITEPTADRLASWVRGVNGLYIRNPGIAIQVRHDPLRTAGENVMAQDVIAQLAAVRGTGGAARQCPSSTAASRPCGARERDPWPRTAVPTLTTVCPHEQAGGRPVSVTVLLDLGSHWP